MNTLSDSFDQPDISPSPWFRKRRVVLNDDRKVGLMEETAHAFNMRLAEPNASSVKPPLFKLCGRGNSFEFSILSMGSPLSRPIATLVVLGTDPYCATCEQLETEMATGTVKWFNPAKGYGFIQPSGGGRDVFVHISAVERAGLSSLNEGQAVEYEMESNRGKESAINLKIR